MPNPGIAAITPPANPTTTIIDPFRGTTRADMPPRVDGPRDVVVT